MIEAVQAATFVRHEIDADSVAASVASQIAGNESRRLRSKEQAAASRVKRASMSEADLRRNGSRAPASDAEIDQYADGYNARERDHYSKVRIIERISDPLDEKRFRLVYGDVEDSASASGTGPFDSIAKATKWFTNNGR